MPVHRFAQCGTVLVAQAFPQYVAGVGSYAIPNRLHVFDWRQGSTLRIGKYCSFAPDVRIFLGGEHRVEWATTYPFSVLWQEGLGIAGHPATKGDVVIGNDVWVGYSATILSGVTVGDGAVIGANANVFEDVPPYAIVAGNPARVVRYRFAPESIARLQALAWWDWPEEKILALLPLMLSADLETFLLAAENTHHPS